MNLRRIALTILTISLLVVSSAKAQEKESCKLSNDTTSGIDMSKIANTLVKRIKLSGYAQAGYSYYSQQSPRDEFKIYRVILMADARIDKHFNTYFMFDFNTGTLHELYLNYKLSDELSIRAGQFKTPFSIENNMSPTVLELIYPSSLATTYMIGGGCALMMPGGAGRDLGINMYGSLFNKKLDYSVAIMNGAGRNKSDTNSQKDFVAQLTLHPLPYLSVSGSMLLGTGNTAVKLSDNDPDTYICTTIPSISGFKGNGNFTRNRYSAGICFDTKPFTLRSEYMHGKDANSNSNGVYATACVKNIFRNFDAVCSYDNLKIYSGKQQRYTAGIQYWFYPKCRLQANYSYKKCDGLPNENCILTQFQVRF